MLTYLDNCFSFLDTLNERRHSSDEGRFLCFNIYEIENRNYIEFVLLSKLINTEIYGINETDLFVVSIRLETEKKINNIGELTYNEIIDQQIKFDGFDETIIDLDLSKYPFLIFAPLTTNNFILRKDDDYYLLIGCNPPEKNKNDEITLEEGDGFF